MPRRNPRKIMPPVAALGLVVALLGACSGGPVQAQVSSSTSASASGSASTTPTGTSSASAGPQIVVSLPESVLAPLPGFSYQPPPSDVQDLAASLSTKPGVEKVFRGAISRAVTVQGRVAGGVELFRFVPSVSAVDRAGVATSLLESFAQSPSTGSTVSGTRVRQVVSANGTSVAAVAWTTGQDLLIVWGPGLTGARGLAGLYLAHENKP